MACVAADGSLSPVAASLLRAAAGAPSAATAEQVARSTGLPLYRVRSTLRELATAGLLAEAEGAYRVTPEGAAKLAALPPPREA